MTYATLMVHLEVGRSNAGVLRIAGELAERFHAGVIGIAACQPMQMAYADGFVPGEVFEQDNNERQKEMEEAQAEFRALLQTRAPRLEWRSSVRFAALPDYVAREARSADLLITGASSTDLLDGSRQVSTGDLITQLGRPVLVVPPTVESLSLAHVLVGWKDSREARRAVWDALPILKKAAQVTVAEIAEPVGLTAARGHVDDVVQWLAQHGVSATASAVPTTGDDSTGLYTIAQDSGADLIVAGAYGHSRLTEWLRGGVTRELLKQDFCALLSH